MLIEIIAAVTEKNSDHVVKHQQWARRGREGFTTALPGGYPDLLARSEFSRATASYGDNMERLLRAKETYDSDNVFSSAIPLPSRVSSPV